VQQNEHRPEPDQQDHQNSDGPKQGTPGPPFQFRPPKTRLLIQFREQPTGLFLGLPGIRGTLALGL